MTCRGWRADLVVAVAALLLAGCAEGGSGAPAQMPAGQAVPVPVASLTCSAPSEAGRLPDRTWIALVSCPARIVVILPGQPATSPSPATPVVSTGDLGPLLAALRQPDATPASVCTAELILLPRFWLVDQDAQAYEPAVPRGPCGEPSAAVASALHALRGD